MKKRIVISYDPRTLGLFIVVGLLLAAPAYLFASPYTVPNPFTPGTTISASEVNANFNQAATAINDNDTRLSNLSLDVVQVNGPAQPCDVGWPNASIAVCPAGYAVVGGGCSFTCQDGAFRHTENIPNDASNQWECRVISGDTGRTFAAKALCAKIAGN